MKNEEYLYEGVYLNGKFWKKIMQTNTVRYMSTKSILDRTDCGILAELQKNARLSNKELAAKVGLAPSSCLERVRRLTSSGVLRGFHAQVDPASLGIGLEALVGIRIAKHSRELIDDFHRYALTLPEVVASFHTGGGNDFLLHIATRDAGHLRGLVLDAFATRPEVEHIETSLVFAHEYQWEWPNFAGPPQD